MFDVKIWSLLIIVEQHMQLFATTLYGFFNGHEVNRRTFLWVSGV